MSRTLDRRIHALERTHRQAFGAWLDTLTEAELLAIIKEERIGDVCTPTAAAVAALVWFECRRTDDGNMTSADLEALTDEQLDRLVNGEPLSVVCPATSVPER